MDDYDDLSQKIIKQATDSLSDDNDQIGELFEIVLNTREQCEMFDELIKNQIKVKDELINKLHKELNYYKQDSADRFVEQLMKAVIKVRKDMLKLVMSERWNNITVEELQKEYKYALEDITDLLEQQNIDPYCSEPGDVFDASIHQAKVEITSDKSLDKKVKESISDGYKKGDKVIIPERVIVYQYKK